LHKKLLTHFFQQFLEGFFPEVAAELDFTDFGPDNFLTQELFPEFKAKTHHLDLVAKVMPKNGTAAAYLIVFIEAQGKRQPDFLARIFRYFALLHIKFGTVVIPIVVYSDLSRKPLAQRWTRYELGFAGHRFLDFRFLAVHPSSMPVREYLNSHNPAQLALAARMNLGKEDMVKIKLDLLRQMWHLAMTEEQIEHAVRYLEAYLEAKDSEAFQRELTLLAQQEYREAGMLIEHFRNIGLTEGRAEGRLQGREEGREEGLAEGIRAKALEDARKLVEHGVSWEIITSATGVKPEDLEAK
jgi:hypothetical protein